MAGKRSTTPSDLRRLVEAEWWEWMPGMLAERYLPEPVAGYVRVLDVWDDSDVMMVHTGGRMCVPEVVIRWNHLPIPSDPATAGCLLEMYLRRGGWLSDLASATPTRKEFASLGDFLVAQLLAGDDR